VDETETTETTDLAVEIIDACGDDPGWLCQRVVEETDNETLATVVDWLVGRPVKIAFLLLLAWLATRVANRVVQRFTNRLATSAGGRMAARRQPDAALSSLSAEVDLRAEQRFQTVGSVLKNVANMVIWAIFLLLVAGEVGVALGPLLAGAGVVGIAIGLGAQGLVRDVVGGLFILVEDQYGVGDVIEAAGRNGVVERVSLRSTRLRDVEGAVWHVPNGEARVVGNRSKGWSRALVDVTIGYGADIDRATEAIMSVGRELRNGQAVHHEILGEPSVWGIEELGEHGVVLRVAVDTRPGSQATVRRELRRAVKDALTAAGIPLAHSAPEPTPPAADPPPDATPGPTPAPTSAGASPPAVSAPAAPSAAAAPTPSPSAAAFPSSPTPSAASSSSSSSGSVSAPAAASAPPSPATSSSSAPSSPNPTGGDGARPAKGSSPPSGSSTNGS
jgi:small-conductance mechanosensitive channel